MSFRSDQFVEKLKHSFSSVGMASRSFAKSRADYYRFMADVLRNSKGKKTMLDIFITDGDRYGKHPRGVLSRYWAAQHQENGADLIATWQGTLPANDLMMISSAVRVGGSGALEQALEDAARISRVITEAKNLFISTIIVGFFALVLAVGMCFAVPFFLLPTVQEAFSFVPLELWGTSGKRMIWFSDFLKTYGIFVLGGLVGLIGGISWALQNYTGEYRRILDEKFLPFKLYRDFQSSIFIATLASMLKKRGNVSMNMREAVEVLRDSAGPWMAWHCTKILQKMEEGAGQTELFDTGLLENETLFFMVDMIETRQMDVGLQLAGARTEKNAVEVIGKKAKILRGVLLALGLSVVFYVAGWLTSVMGELKAATSLVFS